MAQPQPLPQPDYAVISNNITESGQSPIAASLAAINQTLQRLETRVGRLEAGLRCERLNAAARLLNSAPGMKLVLQPLYSPITNEVVKGFPRTKQDMNNLSVAQVTELLHQLEQPVQGKPEYDLRHLMIICGIVWL
ncbi:hypothetical protein F4860DRAFT_511020 [Xylaria cubensis]|nr:hypothetical protein F4860DRAFT_511020 [Xylaria cubensis]